VTKIIKQYRVLYRSADRYATYMAVTSEGSELLSISPDGSRYTVVEGVDLNQAFWGGGDRHVTHVEDPTVIDVDPVEDRYRLSGKFIEPPAEHTPADLVVDKPVEAVDDDDRAEIFVDESVEPELPAVDPAVEEAALSIASQVRIVGSLPRGQLFQGMNQSIADQYLAHAEAMEWLIIADGQVRPGAVDPRPRAVTLIPN
jgi:hypothetical protein